jgi:predicted small lipoprotein YifL
MPQVFVILAAGPETEVTRLPALFRRLLTPVALAAALFVAGCGIKGPLDLPEGANVAASDSKDSKGRAEFSPNTSLPGYRFTDREKKTQKQLGTPAKPNEPFVLDPLLN